MYKVNNYTSEYHGVDSEDVETTVAFDELLQLANCSDSNEDFFALEYNKTYISMGQYSNCDCHYMIAHYSSRNLL